MTYSARHWFHRRNAGRFWRALPCRFHPGEGGIAACGESVRECHEIPRTLGLTALLTTALPFEHALDLAEMLVAVRRSGDHEKERSVTWA